MRKAQTKTPAQELFDDGLWITVADLARRKKITRQSASERVKRLAADNLITVRRNGRSTLVNLAEFDRAVGAVGDASKEAGAATKNDDATADASAKVNPQFRDHQTREKQYSADLKFLELGERLGTLIPAAGVEDSAIRVGEAIVRVIDRLPNAAQALAAAVCKDGEPGARGALKEIAREIRHEIAVALTAFANNSEPTQIEATIEAAGEPDA